MVAARRPSYPILMATTTDRLRHTDGNINREGHWRISWAAALDHVSRRRELARARRAADEQLEYIAGTVVPATLVWRTNELLSRDNRRSLARQMHKLSRMANEKFLITSVPVSVSTLWANRDRLAGIANLLEDFDQPVAPRGIVMLDKLLCNSLDSPLYHRHQPYELAAALQQIRDALDPTISWGAGAVSPTS